MYRTGRCACRSFLQLGRAGADRCHDRACRPRLWVVICVQRGRQRGQDRYQPAYSPDLNPVEAVRKELKKYAAAIGIYGRKDGMIRSVDYMVQDGTVITPALSGYALDAIRQGQTAAGGAITRRGSPVSARLPERTACAANPASGRASERRALRRILGYCCGIWGP